MGGHGRAFRWGLSLHPEIGPEAACSALVSLPRVYATDRPAVGQVVDLVVAGARARRGRTRREEQHGDQPTADDHRRGQPRGGEPDDGLARAGRRFEQFSRSSPTEFVRPSCCVGYQRNERHGVSPGAADRPRWGRDHERWRTRTTRSFAGGRGGAGRDGSTLMIGSTAESVAWRSGSSRSSSVGRWRVCWWSASAGGHPSAASPVERRAGGAGLASGARHRRRRGRRGRRAGRRRGHDRPAGARSPGDRLPRLGDVVVHRWAAPRRVPAGPRGCRGAGPRRAAASGRGGAGRRPRSPPGRRRVLAGRASRPDGRPLREQPEHGRPVRALARRGGLGRSAPS